MSIADDVALIEEYETLKMMRKYGGSFVQALAELASRADAKNLAIIKQTWPEYWKEYSEMAKQQQGKTNEHQRDKA